MDCGGLLSGAAGLFVIPGLGAIAAAGPIVQAIAGALSGAALTGGAMAGAAGVSELTVAIHQLGVPQEELEHLHEAIAQGHTAVILRCGIEETETRRRELAACAPQEIADFPFVP